MFCCEINNNKTKMRPYPLMGTVPVEKNIFCFYAIMHRITIVENKIISIICSCLGFLSG